MMEPTGQGSAGFEWDETLYQGSAAYYGTGRVPYPPEVAKVISAELGLDGTGRLLDCGCGPGSLTLLLAPLFAEAIGIDADAGMIEAARAASADSPALAGRVSWRPLRAEELPAGLGRFRLVTFAQSFHWVDQPVVARAVARMLVPGGACALVYASTHEGVPGEDELEYPRPPRAAIAALIESHLGPVRRAGRGTLPAGLPDGGRAAMRAAGFTAPRQLDAGGDVVHVRTEVEVVASVFSLSSATPHLFGARRAEFEAALRALLRAASPAGLFAERMRGAAVEIWRPAAG